MKHYRVHLSKTYKFQIWHHFPLWKRIVVRLCGWKIEEVIEPPSNKNTL